jgi:lysophospholipase L1-like esterase
VPLSRTLRRACAPMVRTIFALAVNAVALGFAHAEARGEAEVHINVTGASNTKCNAVPNVICYWRQAQTRITRKVVLTNSAVNGSTAADFNQHFAERVQAFYSGRFRYNILTLQSGGNDILANVSAENTLKELKAIVAKWKALGTGTFAVVATVPRFGYSPSQLIEADKLNQQILSEPSFDATFDIGGIRQLGQGEGCPPKNLSPDCSHLTTAGNRLVAPLFAAAVNSVLSFRHNRFREPGLAN